MNNDVDYKYGVLQVLMKASSVNRQKNKDNAGENDSIRREFFLVWLAEKTEW